MEKIAGCDIRALAEKYGTPLYIYDKSRFIENYNRLKSVFDNYYPKTKIHFSVKANSNIHVLNVFREAGAGVDCSSPIEYLLARKAGFDHAEILYTGNYEAVEEFSEIDIDKIKVNLDDISSFRRIIKAGKPGIISFRINPGIGRGGFEGITTAGTDAKFGVPYEMAQEGYKLAKDAGINRFGIHMMTGSNNLEPYYFAEITDKLMTIAGSVFQQLGIKPEYVDIGGGLGIPYQEGEEELNVDRMAKLVSDTFREKCDKYGFGEPELLLEPGRYLAADAGYLISRITGVKKSYKTFVGIDSGMNTLIRPALYGTRHRVHVYGKHENEDLVSLCGQVCENSDIFARNIPFPRVEEGDLVIFRDAGAYGFVMASNYNNRLRPAEVLVDGESDKLIRRRERIEDLMGMYEI